MTRLDDAKRNGASAGGTASPGGPQGPLSDSLAKPLPKRFYTSVGITDVEPFGVLLDGRGVKTPKKQTLALPSRALAEAIANEWQAQGALINPAGMPLTRFANTAIDAVRDALDAVAADIAAYAGSDLLCYRAEGPADLVALQARHWDPVLRWAHEALQCDFVVVTGVMPTLQPAQALEAVACALRPHDAFRLTGLHVLTSLTGSAVLALAHMRGVLSADAAWSAAHVDEDYQIAAWGEDDAARARRQVRRAEFDAASRFLQLLDR